MVGRGRQQHPVAMVLTAAPSLPVALQLPPCQRHHPCPLFLPPFLLSLSSLLSHFFVSVPGFFSERVFLCPSASLCHCPHHVWHQSHLSLPGPLCLPSWLFERPLSVTYPPLHLSEGDLACPLPVSPGLRLCPGLRVPLHHRGVSPPTPHGAAVRSRRTLRGDAL